jgi:glutathione S-transferase
MSEETDLTTRDIAQQGAADPADEPTTRERDGGADGATAQREPLLPGDATGSFVERWTAIQTSFVDQPQQSVHEADALVAELMQELARSFSDAREHLEQQWASGDDVSTEDLRIALQRYRSFFDRLLAA